MFVRITLADNFPDGEWLDAALASDDAPVTLQRLLDGVDDYVDVDTSVVYDPATDTESVSESAAIAAWAATIPGWEAREDGRGGACRPLVFTMVEEP